MDCVTTIWTTCEAVVEEVWTLRAPSNVLCEWQEGTRTLDELLNADDVEVVKVENLTVHSERNRRVLRTGVERTPDLQRQPDDA